MEELHGIEDTQLTAKLLEELPEILNWRGDHYTFDSLWKGPPRPPESKRALLGRSPSQYLLATSRRADGPVLPDSALPGMAGALVG